MSKPSTDRPRDRGQAVCAISRQSWPPLAALGRGAEAAAQFEKALGLNPNYAEAHSSLGDALRDQGRLEQALACYERGAALKPSAENENKAGATLLTLGRLAEAIARCDRAAAMNPVLSRRI